MITKDIELNRRLAVVWMNEPPSRYIPRALGNGPGWDVWDRKRGRFLKRKEIKQLSFEQVCEKLEH